VIGNDIVDLALARKESNWQRPGFLDKIFSIEEQFLILNAENPEEMVWNLWSRKEAAYKIYNRETGIRAYIPIQLECIYETKNTGSVLCNGRIYYTKTKILNDVIHTIAVVKKQYFKNLKAVDKRTTVFKNNGIPFVICNESQQIIPVSISHHGRFSKTILLDRIG
jgi:phosphopantetheinyl transferase (holo-ACP synthase)